MTVVKTYHHYKCLYNKIKMENKTMIVWQIVWIKVVDLEEITR